jgi:hypothetical protein
MKTPHEIMEQAQVFASSWSLVGSRFDNGDEIDNANEQKADLHKMVNALLAERDAWHTAHDEQVAKLLEIAAERDSLKADARVPMTETAIRATWELLVDNNTDDIVMRFARELEAHHGIGGAK